MAENEKKGTPEPISTIVNEVLSDTLTVDVSPRLSQQEIIKARAFVLTKPALVKVGTRSLEVAAATLVSRAVISTDAAHPLNDRLSLRVASDDEINQHQKRFALPEREKLRIRGEVWLCRKQLSRRIMTAKRKSAKAHLMAAFMHELADAEIGIRKVLYYSPMKSSITTDEYDQLEMARNHRLFELSWKRNALREAMAEVSKPLLAVAEGRYQIDAIALREYASYSWAFDPDAPEHEVMFKAHEWLERLTSRLEYDDEQERFASRIIGWVSDSGTKVIVGVAIVLISGGLMFWLGLKAAK